MIHKLKKRRLMKHKKYIGGLGSAGILGIMGVFWLVGGLLIHFDAYKTYL